MPTRIPGARGPVFSGSSYKNQAQNPDLSGITSPVTSQINAAISQSNRNFQKKKRTLGQFQSQIAGISETRSSLEGEFQDLASAFAQQQQQLREAQKKPVKIKKPSPERGPRKDTFSDFNVNRTRQKRRLLGFLGDENKNPRALGLPKY